ncbi:hypothetical protein HDU93_000385 [Gonapodya sp. JEL0774]|nr:hypothetical protein HDU93_000385 [Gonapodya sp. JEL0774]
MAPPTLETLPLEILPFIFVRSSVNAREIARMQAASKTIRSRIFAAKVWEKAYTTRFSRTAHLAKLISTCGLEIDGSFGLPDNVTSDLEWKDLTALKAAALDRFGEPGDVNTRSEAMDMVVEEIRVLELQDVTDDEEGALQESAEEENDDIADSESDGSDNDLFDDVDVVDAVAAEAREGDQAAEGSDGAAEAIPARFQNNDSTTDTNTDTNQTDDRAPLDPDTAISGCFALLHKFDETGREDISLLVDAANGTLAVVGRLEAVVLVHKCSPKRTMLLSFPDHSPTLVQSYHILAFIAFITNNLAQGAHIAKLGRAIDPLYQPLVELETEIADVAQRTGLITAEGRAESADSVPLLVSTSTTTRPTLSPPFLDLLRGLHARFDTDADGLLSPPELSSLIEAANGRKPEKAQVKGLVELFGVPAPVKDGADLDPALPLSGKRKSKGDGHRKASSRRKAGVDVDGLAEFFLVQTLEDAEVRKIAPIMQEVFILPPTFNLGVPGLTLMLAGDSPGPREARLQSENFTKEACAAVRKVGQGN